MASRFFRVVVESFESEAAGMKTVVSAGDAAAGHERRLVLAVDAGSRPMLVVPQNVGQMLMQRATGGDHQQLHAAADAENGYVRL